MKSYLIVKFSINLTTYSFQFKYVTTTIPFKSLTICCAVVLCILFLQSIKFAPWAIKRNVFHISNYLNVCINLVKYFHTVILNLNQIKTIFIPFQTASEHFLSVPKALPGREIPILHTKYETNYRMIPAR